MKILAFDTSTEYCSTALHLDDGHLLKKDIRAERRHSELLLPMIKDMLDEAELSLSDLDGLAFGAGPGSFTGLRIACGVAQGLAFATQLPVIGISTLEAIAQQNKHDRTIVAMDARMGEIYLAAYIRQNASWYPVVKPKLCKPDEATVLTDAGWIGCGSGFDVYPEELQAVYHKNLSEIYYRQYPHAQEIAHLAAMCPSEAYVTDPAQAAPIYIRNKVALKESER
ncbi:MAG: tRNA (adenosine(37)-N6)-threonylcarbamoyltransferase complex dimerization subunit type 1 TsaB [Nitrosomonas sp.]|nr:tRNA (adenosine(37)-N6)-threonylcarbamoyltransferase complex dimerization subunit type 1 TsaB [Nitrosomonas sp.]